MNLSVFCITLFFFFVYFRPVNYETQKGSRIDSAAVKSMDANSWSDYENLDRNICKRNHQELIQSLIASKASETEAKAKKSVDDFAKLCALRDEDADLRRDVQREVTEKNELVKIERIIEEQKRRKMEAEKRQKDKAKRFQDKRSEMEKEHAKLCKSREEAEMEIEIQEDRYKTTRNEIKLLEKELSKKEGGWVDVGQLYCERGQMKRSYLKLAQVLAALM